MQIFLGIFEAEDFRLGGRLVKRLVLELLVLGFVLLKEYISGVIPKQQDSALSYDRIPNATPSKRQPFKCLQNMETLGHTTEA